MTQQHIYHLNAQGQLEPMQEEPFALEDKLQELVADYPGLLSGEQMNPDNPRRFILIGREQGIADIIGGGHRWSLDHLLIDQDAIPTLVEAKRQGSSEIRRSIVGQMMDYAAHATQTWNVEDIRQAFEERVAAAGQDSDSVLSELLQSEWEMDSDAFWQQVETNLRAARLRLLFVADGIPDELTRVVEFLNEQMPGIEVLAVEIKQFLGEAGSSMLVPRVIGRTAEAVAAPGRQSGGSKRARSRISRDDFFAQMPNDEVRQAASRLMDITEKGGGSVVFGDTGISLRCNFPAQSKPTTVAWIYPFAERSSWAQTREFTFGMPIWDKDEQAPQVVEILENWTSQIENAPFSSGIISTGVAAHWVSHQDAAAAENINTLAERLDKVLRELRDLPAGE